MGLPAIARDVQGDEGKENKQFTSQFFAKKIKTLKNTKSVFWVWRGGGLVNYLGIFCFCGVRDGNLTPPPPKKRGVTELAPPQQV